MIRALLVDDEENALDILEVLLQQIGNVEIIGRYLNPLQAAEDIRHLQVDAVFLDIDMPGMSGMELAHQIQAIDSRTRVIFTTAYASYAVKAFEIESLDYLLKPFTLERLRNTIRRIESTIPHRTADASGCPRIRCMGSFHILPHGHEERPLRWRTGKEKELCAFLIHHFGQTVDHAVIMEALWPEAGHTARSYLYTCVSLLRKNLQANKMGALVNKSDNGYGLLWNEVEYDAIELERLLDKTLAEEGLSERRYQQIILLYKGEYLGDCDYLWAHGKRNELSLKYTHALRKLFVFFKKNGFLAPALDCLQHILSVVPESEQDGRELIKLHMEAGNRNEAIQAYRRLEQAVHEQLGVDLEDETVRLYRQLIFSRRQGTMRNSV